MRVGATSCAAIASEDTGEDGFGPASLTASGVAGGAAAPATGFAAGFPVEFAMVCISPCSGAGVVPLTAFPAGLGADEHVNTTSSTRASTSGPAAIRIPFTQLEP